MKYIFATDVDGTLLMDNKEIHPETLAAFKRSQNLDHINVIATGRSVKQSLELIKKIPYIDYLVCNNGANVYDIKENKSIVLHGVNPIHYIKINDFAKEHKKPFKVHTNNDWFGYPENEDENVSILTDEIDQQIRKHIFNFPNDQKLFNGQTITQLSIYSKDNFCKEHYELFNEWFSNDSSVYLTNSVYLDVNPKNISKWSGLFELSKYLNIDKNCIIAFGDSGNDYEMLLNAGKNGYAMENSHPDLIQKIKPRIGSNNTGAIGKKINEYLDK